MRKIVLMISFMAGALQAETVNFDSAPVGEPLKGWTLTKTKDGNPKWEVAADPGASSKPNVLKQSGNAAYPVAFKNDVSIKDGFVEVKYKAVSGEEDQAGGIVWRVKDADNYYICRGNSLENNVRIYHFVGGKRSQFKGLNMPVPANQWHTLRVEFSGKESIVKFNGKELFRAEDETLTEAGKVGVWTKADSVTLFDDFSYGGK